MFGIGVLVGRGTSPLKIDISQLQKKLQIARAELKKKELRQTPKKSDFAKDKPELEFYETLKKNDEDAKISGLPPNIISVPRPAILVEMVMEPFRPA